MSVPTLDTLEIEPTAPATASVIWMHGLGADAHDFYPVPPQLGLPERLAVRYIFPNAPYIPVTINQGMMMRAWYDLARIDRSVLDEAGIRRSSAWIEELVRREQERGVPAGRVVLAGFSQGGAMALFTGTRYAEPLAGIACLSGYLLFEEALEREVPGARRVPIFQAHGTADPMVPYALGRESRDRLMEAGFAVDWREYPMGHTVCPEEIRDIGRWIATVLTG